MNKPLRRVAIAGMLLLVVLMINVNYIQGSQADKLKNDPLNSRQYDTQFQHNRGAILAGKVTIARSVKESGDRNKTYRRVYSDGAVYAPVTGYVSLFQRTGLELAYNSLLDGTDKRLTIRNWFDTLVGKKPAGATVQTTIVPKAQQVAYDDIKGKTQRRGAAVAIDVKTGAILAMASYPSFDTNKVTSTGNSAQASKEFKKLEKDRDKPDLNKAMNETFQPGSSFKIVDSAAAIDGGGFTKDTPADAGPLTLPSGHNLANSDGDEAACNGSPPLIKSFAASCNTTFGRLALRLKQQRLGDMAAKFGWNKPIEIEPGMSSAASVYPTKEIGGDQLARSGIGQDVVTATPLQMAMVAQAVANDGTQMKPYLVKRVTAPDQSELATAKQEELGHPITPGTADQIQDMMREVVISGTAATAIRGEDIAGKTGTAETGFGLNEDWFVGFAPQHNPKVAFAVVTEGPSGSAGATFSAPIAVDIVRAVS